MSKEIDYNCEKTWELFHDGKTKGVFQLESSLGKSWSKKLKPNTPNESGADCSFCIIRLSFSPASTYAPSSRTV